MAKTFKFGDCSMIGELRAHLKDEYSMMVPEYVVDNVFRSLFQSCALMVKYHADKKYHKTGFSLKDINGEFVLGTILTFNPPEDEDSEDGGNWNLDMTFNQKDMEDCDYMLDNFSDVYLTILNSQMYAQFRGHCASNRDLSIIITECIKAILHFLDGNSNDSNEDVILEMDDVFVASVGFEDGKKVYTIVPGAAIKQYVKNDDAVEKKDFVTKEAAELAAAAYSAAIQSSLGNFFPHQPYQQPYYQPIFIAMN